MHTVWLAALVLLVEVCAAQAAATLPESDAQGTRDHPLLGRYEGSLILSQGTRAFDELSLPLSPLQRTDRVDRNNSVVYAPRERKDLEGRLTRTLYLIPPGRSTLEVVRNYQDEIRGKGGEILYECAGDACGGDVNRGIGAVLGSTGLLVWLLPAEQLQAQMFSTLWCALTTNHAQQRYTAARLPGPEGDAHVAVIAYVFNDNIWGDQCLALYGRVLVLTTIVEPKPREQRMVMVSSAEIRQGMASQGHVALYEIQFDFNKADIRSDSGPQLEEIGRLLREDTRLKLFVVGHTDGKGGVGYNLDLSRRRADAVVAALVKGYGIDRRRLASYGVGQLAPLAPNDTDEGRAKNRRVELVPQE